MQKKNKMLVLENGKFFYGEGFGSVIKQKAELVFNTSMVGYQEMLSDPSNCGKIIVMSYPLIGNYGLTDEDYVSKGNYVAGLVVSEYNDNPSNFRYTKTLGEVMEDDCISGISGIDTREIVRILRSEGTMRAMICDATEEVGVCVAELKNFNAECSTLDTVSTKKPWYSKTRNHTCNVVAIDLGIRNDIIKKLNDDGCNVIVVPYNVTKEEILKYNPDGLFISNGADNPAILTGVAALVKSLIGVVPMLGTGLGHQIIALAYDAKTYKMKTGHRGGNHPIKNVETGKVDYACQNHGYAIDADSLKGTGLEVAFINLLDGEIEGTIDKKNKVVGVQGDPDAPVITPNSGFALKTFTGFMQAGGKK